MVLLDPLWSYSVQFRLTWSIRSYSVHFGSIGSTVILFGPIWPYLVDSVLSVQFGPIWFILSTSVQFGPFSSTSILFHFGPIRSTFVLSGLLWSYSVYFGPIRSVQFTLVLLGPILSTSVELVQIDQFWSTSIHSDHFGPFHPLWFISAYFCALT